MMECERALRINGAEFNRRKTEEECMELALTLRHYEQGKCTEEDVIDEIADVWIMLHINEIQFGSDRISDAIRRKLERMRTRLDSQENAA